MADQKIIDDLIATYRELNHRVRGRAAGPARPDTELASDTSSVSGILFQMRTRELRASQSIKHLLLGGEALGEDEAPADPGELTDAPHTASVLLLQFGTAREATLSQVRELPDEDWNRNYITPQGEMPLRDYLVTLVNRDRQRMQEIDGILESRGFGSSRPEDARVSVGVATTTATVEPI
jgi:hypothetical protein